MNTEDVNLRNERAAALRVLVTLEYSVEAAISQLSQFEWDCGEELITFSREDALRALRLHKQHLLHSGDFGRWAEALEGRDDLAFETGFEELLKEFLFEVATPEINYPLTMEQISRWEMALG